MLKFKVIFMNMSHKFVDASGYYIQGDLITFHEDERFVVAYRVSQIEEIRIA